MVSITPDNPVQQIANVHTVFNIVTTVVLLPFGGAMVALTKKIIPETQQEEDDRDKQRGSPVAIQLIDYGSHLKKLLSSR